MRPGDLGGRQALLIAQEDRGAIRLLELGHEAAEEALGLEAGEQRLGEVAPSAYSTAANSVSREARRVVERTRIFHTLRSTWASQRRMGRSRSGGLRRAAR